MSYVPRTMAGKALALVAFIAVSLASIVTAYKVLGFPIPAWAQDIKNLERQRLDDLEKAKQRALASDRRQADTAIEVYQNKYRSFLSQPAPENPAATRAWEIELDRAIEQLGRAEQRKIELSR